MWIERLRLDTVKLYDINVQSVGFGRREKGPSYLL